MKAFVILLFFISTSISFYSQSKTSVAILPFNYSNCSSADAYVISEAVVSSFVKAKRFAIVDRTKMNEVNKEKNLQKTEDFIDAVYLADQGKSLGAQYLISGVISSVKKSSENKQRTKSDGTIENYVNYLCSISFSCKVIEVETGQITNSESFDVIGGQPFLGGKGATDTETAFKDCMSSLDVSLEKWIGRNFPVLISLVEIQESNRKGDATKLLIAGGSELGLQKLERLKVVEITFVNVNGKAIERRKEIGEVRITEVEDSNFSVCNVTSGGDLISQKVKSGTKLSLITIK